MTESVAKTVIESILAEYIKRIVEKASKGKKLSDWEVGILMMDYARTITYERINGLEKRIDVVEKNLYERIENVRESLGERINGLEKRIDVVEKNLYERIENVRESLGERIDVVEENHVDRMSKFEKEVGDRISDLEKRLNERIDSLEKRLGERIESRDRLVAEKIESISTRLKKVEDDVDYIKRSLDSLRDNVINVLVAELKRRMEREV